MTIHLYLTIKLCTHIHTQSYIHTHACTHTAMAAAFCKQVCGRQLILTHFSQRYKSQGAELQPGEESTEKLLSEAREAVGDSGTTVHLAEDFRTFTIPAKK